MIPSRVRFAHVVAALAVIAAVAALLAPPPGGIEPATMRAAAVVIFTIGMWATGVLPEYLTAVIFMFLAVVVAGLPPVVVMSGFHSSALWLIFGGLILSLAVNETGLARRVAHGVVGRLHRTYFGAVCGVVLVSAAFGLVMPSSTGRVLVILPIVLALAGRLGFTNGSKGYTGMALAVPAGTLLPTFAILPANVPNMAMAGAAESIHGIHVTYAAYMVQHFPVAAPVTLAALPFAIVWLFPARAEGGGTETGGDPITRRELRLMVILAGAIGLWLTDTIHGVSPAWVSMGAALLCLLPGIGVMAPQAMVEKNNFGPWFFLAGMIGLGAVVAHSGLGMLVGNAIVPFLDLAPGNDAGNFASLVGLGMGMGLVTTMPGQPAIMTALAQDLATATGWPLYHVLMAQVPSWSLFLFPYQVPPLFIAMALARIGIGQGIRFCLPFALFNLAVLVPLQYVWWRFMGYIG